MPCHPSQINAVVWDASVLERRFLRPVTAFLRPRFGAEADVDGVAVGRAVPDPALGRVSLDSSGPMHVTGGYFIRVPGQDTIRHRGAGNLRHHAELGTWRSINPAAGSSGPELTLRAAGSSGRAAANRTAPVEPDQSGRSPIDSAFRGDTDARELRNNLRRRCQADERGAGSFHCGIAVSQIPGLPMPGAEVNPATKPTKQMDYWTGRTYANRHHAGRTQQRAFVHRRVDSGGEDRMVLAGRAVCGERRVAPSDLPTTQQPYPPAARVNSPRTGASG